MTTQEEAFETLLQRLRDGSPEAAQEFHDKYGNFLLRVIRRRLEKRLRSRFDSMDFQQDVYASFFRELPPPEAFSSSKAFFSYLTTMARRKVLDALRHRLSATQNEGTPLRSLDGSARYEGMQQIGPEPRPSQVFMAEERVRDMTRGKPAKYQKIIDLARLGCSHVEIAERLEIHVKVVRRVIKGLNEQLAN